MSRRLNIIDLAKMVNGRVAGAAEQKADLSGTCAVDKYVSGRVSFVKSAKYAESLRQLEGAVILIPENMESLAEKYPRNTYVVVQDAAISMMDVQEFFYARTVVTFEEGVSPSADIRDSARIGAGSYIGAGVYVGKNVVIGDRTKIMQNTSILDNVVIGDDAFIYPGVCIYPRCVIGNDCLIHAGACIGSDGFRFEQDYDRSLVRKMHHAGRVIIGDRVEIGANAAIDRATFEDEATCISDDVKIDNLVHIGHNACIGARSLVAALSVIGGSDRIGEDVWIGIGATISNGVTVGNRAKILLNGVVAYDVPEDEVVSGFYAMPHRQWKKAWRRLKEEG